MLAFLAVSGSPLLCTCAAAAASKTYYSGDKGIQQSVEGSQRADLRLLAHNWWFTLYYNTCADTSLQGLSLE